MVDTVLSFEGERSHQYRILRAIKNRFGGTDEIAQHLGDMDQDVVAHFVAELVVDRLERVHIDKHQSAGRVFGVQAVNVALHLLEEGAAVEQAGQRIGASLAAHFLLNRLMFQDHTDDTGGG